MPIIVNFFKNKLFIFFDKYLFFLLFLLSLTFFFEAYKTIDPDFGWHIRTGEIILNSGVPENDPFSYTMPSYRFIDHEWLVDIFLFKTFTVFGQLGLSLIFLSVMISLWFLLFKDFRGLLRGKEDKYWVYGILLLSFLSFLPFFGIRPQVISWLFVFLLLGLLKEKIFDKYGFLFPFFMFIWANLHGSFATGIVIYLIFHFFKFIRTKKISIKTIVIIFAGIFLTFLNPYGLSLWKEVYMSISDSSLRWRIIEWMPSFSFFDLPYLFFLSLSLCLIWKYKEKIKIEYLALYVFFLIQSILSVRHVPLWVIISLPIMGECLSFLKIEINKIKEGENRYFIAGKYIFCLILLLFFYQTLTSIYSKTKKKIDFYPTKAVEFLKNSENKGEIFSQYGWGGYLIWKLPSKKVYIDGRMPSWRRKNAPENESKNAMSDYEKIFTEKGNFQKQFNKYNVKYVLLPPSVEIKPSVLGTLLKSFIKDKEQYDLVKSLQKEGWKEIYKDNTVVIYSY